MNYTRLHRLRRIVIHSRPERVTKRIVPRCRLHLSLASFQSSLRATVRSASAESRRSSIRHDADLERHIQDVLCQQPHLMHLMTTSGCTLFLHLCRPASPNFTLAAGTSQVNQTSDDLSNNPNPLAATKCSPVSLKSQGISQSLSPAFYKHRRPQFLEPEIQLPSEASWRRPPQIRGRRRCESS